MQAFLMNFLKYIFSYWEKLQHIRLGEQRMSLQNHFSQLNHLALEMVKG